MQPCRLSAKPCALTTLGPTLQKPFRRVVILGYYDGPTDGIAQCDCCGSWFRFDLLDWDPNAEDEVVSLSRLTTEAAERLLAVYPESPWTFPTKEEEERAHAEIAAALAVAAEPEWVMLTPRCFDGPVTIRRVDELDAQPADLMPIEVGDSPVRNWYGVMRN